MAMLLIIGLVIAGLVVWIIFAFVRYKREESKDKIRVASYLALGMSLSEALEKSFEELNASLPNKLDANTVSTVARKISSLQSMMDVRNAVEIYSTFIHRYVCRNTIRPHPNVTDDNVLYAVHNMRFDQRHGYFVLKPDSGEDFDKKYPKVAP